MGDNDIYRLYKYVFGSKYLSCIIYNKIREANKEFVRKSKNNLYRTFRYKYEEVPLDFIIKRNKYELLKDRIKNKVPFKASEINVKNLPNLVKMVLKLNTEISMQEFVHFISKELLTQHDHYSLIELNISSNNLAFFREMYHEIVSYITSDDYAIQNEKRNRDRDFNSLQITDKQKEERILISALRIGNIDILYYIHFIIGLKLSTLNPKQLFNYGIKSCYRDEVLEFLITDLGLPVNFTMDNDKIDRLKFSRFLKALRLNQTMFQRIKNLDAIIHSMRIFSHEVDTVIRNYVLINKMILPKLFLDAPDPKQYDLISFDQFLNFLRNSISYLMVSEFKEGEKKDKLQFMLKKINHLVWYENNRTLSYLLSYVPSVFRKKKLKEEKEFGINYNDFDIIRELKRIFVFEYLDTIFQETSSRTFQYKFDFIMTYKEYDLAYQTLSLLNKEDEDIGIEVMVLMAIRKADASFIKVVHQVFEKSKTIDKFKHFFHDISFGIRPDRLLYNRELYDFEHQINFFLAIIDKNNDFYISHYILNFILGNNNITIEKLEIIINIIKKVGFGLPGRKRILNFDSYYLFVNKDKDYDRISSAEQSLMILDYCYKNYNGLFDWNSNRLELATEALRYNNLELILFVHERNMGHLNVVKNYLLDYCLSLKILKYMYEILGYRFNTIDNMVRTDNWELFDYAFQKISKDNFPSLLKSLSIKRLSSPPVIITDYQIGKCIENFCQSNGLKINPILLIYLHDVNLIINNGNKKNLKLFLKDSDNPTRKDLTNLTIDRHSFDLINNKFVSNKIRCSIFSNKNVTYSYK